MLYIDLQGSLYYQTDNSMWCVSVCKTCIFSKRSHFNLELMQRTSANIFQFIRSQAQSMEINSSDEFCHHIVIPTLPFFEMKQTYATLCPTSATPNASWDFPRAVCKAAPWWEPWHMGECKGCCALSESYELMNQENKLFSVHALPLVLFLMPAQINRIILLLQLWNKSKFSKSECEM